MTLTGNDSQTLTWSFIYAVVGDEPEGIPVPVVVSLVDEFGNPADEISLGSVIFDFSVDADGDGFGNVTDCDDNDAQSFPNAPEACDGVDNDCDENIDEDFDADSDGVATCAGDCDDLDPDIYPGAAERCNDEDDDCDTLVDEDFRDALGRYDGELHCGSCGNDCASAGFPNASGSCDTSVATPRCAPVCDPNFVDVDTSPVNGCECEITSPGDTPDGTDANCDGVDGDAAAAVFVSAAGNELNPGTLESPLRSIGDAIAIAAAAVPPMAVYVSAGRYEENVTLEPGVMLFGGYAADFATRDPTSNVSEIRGRPYLATEALGAVNCVDINGSDAPTAIDGFSVLASDGIDAGANSYGVYARNCDGALSVTNNAITAGTGSDSPSGPAGDSGLDGIDGEDGLDALDVGVGVSCLSTSPGGAGGIGVCSVGGDGGAAICADWNETEIGVCFVNTNQTSTAAESGAAGTGASAGNGGPAGQDASLSDALSCGFAGPCFLCRTPGSNPAFGADAQSGGDGADGAPGLGCVDSTGSVTNGQWSGGAADTGNAGDPGSGGGGGGAAGGAEADAACTNTGSQRGGSGGGGGGGACGGVGGGAGEAGGGSFGIFVVFDAPPVDTPTIVGNTIVGGRGGDGGAGGSGGLSGKGGARGLGGDGGLAFNSVCAREGGNGGRGGDGGAGSGGGGACGGVAYGIFVAGLGALPLPDLVGTNVDGGGYIAGAAGLGGTGGAATNAGTAGVLGATAFVGP